MRDCVTDLDCDEDVLGNTAKKARDLVSPIPRIECPNSGLILEVDTRGQGRLLMPVRSTSSNDLSEDTGPSGLWPLACSRSSCAPSLVTAAVADLGARAAYSGERLPVRHEARQVRGFQESKRPFCLCAVDQDCGTSLVS
jgi:hypothetical protein